MIDTVFGALAQMLPDRVIAASEGGNTGVSIGGYHADRSPFIFVEFICSAWGGRPWADGLDGNANLFANMSLPSAEVTETEQPLEILCCELMPDVGGPGKHRGGMSVRRAYRLLADEAVLQVRADRHAFRPYGLYGGRPGQPSHNYLRSNGQERELTAKVTMTPMRRGDVFVHEQPGTGGWGDPLERDPARVLRDVRSGLVSAAAARADYGVVLDPVALVVDASATERLRAEQRAARGWTRPPFVTR
jgi:N-methylhydantoinase B